VSRDRRASGRDSDLRGDYGCTVDSGRDGRGLREATGRAGRGGQRAAEDCVNLITFDLLMVWPLLVLVGLATESLLRRRR